MFISNLWQMEKIHNTFVGFLFSRKLIGWMLLLNFIEVAYFYVLTNEPESFYVGNGWIVCITAFMGFIWTAFYLHSFLSYKAKKKDTNK